MTQKSPVKQGSRAASPRKASIRRQNQAVILAAAEDVFAERGYAGASMSEIARRADLPKANLHYYFGTKEELYRAVLDDILTAWRHDMDGFRSDADPKQAVSAYIRLKLDFSHRRASGSKVFANEIIHGASVLGDALGDLVRAGIAGKDKVVDEWVTKGLIAPVDGRHFFIMLWAMTQHYADFEVQIRKVLGKEALTEADWREIAIQVETFVLRALCLPV
ncbi:MAG TPA: TetR family transcriptional regulator C-terminal domain-containing protein [Candidatus Sulfotelmatobacter sp.]|jgi:TetR/AcrR family transcriptional regulator|nr:TetR family transcriptional regulator C-terminal domain-containing protein [Candidatus Sulfotelmatobacter sp.]